MVRTDDRADLTDAEIAERIAGGAPGEATAEEAELYRRFAPRVRLYGRRHLGSDDAADDLAQRVLALSIEKLRAGAVREPARIASFVLGSARMVSRELRRDARRAEPMTDALDERAAPAPERAEPLARDRLARCLAALGERERAVVVLSYFGDHSAAEIARSLSLSEGNVRVIRHRSIARLRACMGLDEEVAA